MSWSIQGDRRYYHRKITRDHRQVSVYIGAGPDAEAVAAEDAAAAAARRALAREHALQYAQARDIDEAAAALVDLVRSLTEASLLVTGHHLDDHGEWKRLRQE